MRTKDLVLAVFTMLSKLVTKEEKRNKHFGVWTVDDMTDDPTAQSNSYFKNFDYFQGSRGRIYQDLNDFFNRTTIAGLIQLTSRRRSIWKTFWMLVSLAGLVMSFYQSKEVLLDFVNGRTVQNIIYRSVRNVAFPSLTLCSHIRLSYWMIQRHPESVEIISILESVCPNRTIEGCIRTVKPNESFGQESVEQRELLRKIMTLQVKLSSTERQELFYGNLTRFMKQCFWKGHKCNKSDTDEISYFSNLLRGNCLTFNPGLSKKLTGLDSREFIIELSMYKKSRKFKFNDVVAVYWVHPPGTAPNLFSENYGRIYPGDKVRIDFQLQNITRIESTSCVNPFSEEHKVKNVYYKQEKPFEYDQDACHFFREEMRARRSNCYHASIPYDFNLYERLQEKNGTLCVSYDEFLECAARDRSPIEGQCRPRCTELFWNRTNSILQLSPTSGVVEEIIEEPKYSAADFLGILGGNLGLWIGVSVISLAEILELAYMMVIFVADLRSRKAGIAEHLHPIQTVEVKKKSAWDK